MPELGLIKPDLATLPAYAAALESGWSPDNLRGRAAAEEQLARIAEDPAGFVESLDDPAGKGPPVPQPDGSLKPRLPGFYRWLWDGEFCGSIGFRWQPGTSKLPPHVLGHMGYSVVPWKRGRGYASRALALMLPEARARGLAYVELTTVADNLPSRRVIEANGGELVERFTRPDLHGHDQALRYRIRL